MDDGEKWQFAHGYLYSELSKQLKASGPSTLALAQKYMAQTALRAPEGSEDLDWCEEHQVAY